MYSRQACEIPETSLFSLLPSEESSQAKPCSVPFWDLLQTGVHGTVKFPLPLKHMLFSLFPGHDGGVGSGSAAWSLPAPIRPDFPRQSLSVPREPDSGGGLSSRWVKRSICGVLAATVHLEQGTEPRLAHHTKPAAGHSLLNSADEAKEGIPSAFPPSVSLLYSVLIFLTFDLSQFLFLFNF